MNKLICIYPEDETTDFLLPIYEQLEKLPNFIGYRFNTITFPQRDGLFNQQNFDKNSILFFLGHGASNKLYGSVKENGEKDELFDKSNIGHIKNMNFVCIACRSKEFAHKQFQNYIGFGDITSDFSEIEGGEFTDGSESMNWATKEDITNFRTEFTSAISDAIKLSKCSSLRSIYKMMRLCFNKHIADLLMNRNIPSYRHIADMLFDVLNEMEFFSDKD